MVREGCRCFAGLSRLRRYRSAPKDVDIRIAESVDTSTSVSKTVDPIVRASSVLSNFVAPPWQLVDLYEGYAPVPTWEDPQGRPELTAKQNTRLSHWIRLFENNDKIKLFNAVPSSSRIRQGFVADCSFLAALAALADYEYRYGVPLLTNIIDFVSVSKDGYAGVLAAEPAEEPRSEPGERQCAIGVKLYFNGSARCVLVDDWIPVRADGRMLCAHSDNPNECWVTILEKAFVKLNGGRYTIGGTNPGVDIYHLTGWIPEILTLPATACSPPDSAGSSGSAKVKWEQVWDVMYAGFSSGSCVVCLGTGEIADAVPYGDGNTEGISRSSGIVSDHAYSVLDIKDVLLRGKHRARLLYLKNPWGSVSWIRRFSPSDTKSWTTELQKTLRYVPDRNRDTGKFWIEWSDVLRWFSHLYISWKPSVFGNRVTVHDVWRHDKRFCHSLVPEDMYMSVFNPQFTLTVNFGGQNSAVVWLLLLQHRQNGEDALKYLTMHVFSRDDAVICPPLPDVQGVYNNGECILVKLLVKNEARGEPPAKHMLTGETVVAYNNGRDNTLLVLLSYYNQKVQVDTPFTIRALSTRPIRLTPRPCLVKPHWKKTVMYGEWTEQNCGGSPNNLWSYFLNPHYRLHFAEAGEAVVLLECSSAISVNLRIFQGRLATFRALKVGHPVTSDEYKIHCCSTYLNFHAGQYVLIPSAFRPGDCGYFRIVVYSKSPCSIVPLPYPRYVASGATGLHSQRVDISGPLHMEVNTPTLVSVSVEVPPGVMSDFFVIFAASSGVEHPMPKELYCSFVANDEFFCLNTACVMCGGPSGRFRKIVRSDHLADYADGYDLVVYSDLNGGNSKTGRASSASARQLYQNQRVVNFTLVELLPALRPYRLTAVGGATRGMVTLTSDSPISLG